MGTASSAQRSRSPSEPQPGFGLPHATDSETLADRFRLPLHQVRRALRQPARWRRLHYGAVLASLHSIVETSDSRLLQLYFDIDGAGLRNIQAALLDDTSFRHQIESLHHRVRGERIRLFGSTAAADHDRGCRLLYLLVRLAKPRIVVETGVFDGFSSAFILKAMEDNRAGRLCSIDLPARRPIAASTDKMRHSTLPVGRGPGWIVPDGLQRRWTLRLGASSELLAPWLEELGEIDLFFHDSLHTFDNMTRELETAWRGLVDGGLLVSDDVFWNRAFWKFAAARRRPGHIVRGMGLIRKAAGAESSR